MLELQKVGFIPKIKGMKPTFFVSLDNSITLKLESIQFIFIELDSMIPFELKNPIAKEDTIQSELYLMNMDIAKKVLFKKVYIEKKYIQHTNNTFSIPNIISFKVFDENNSLIGTIENIIETKSGYLLSVMDYQSNKEILIPYHKNIIRNIDNINTSIYCDIPKGLINIYLKN